MATNKGLGRGLDALLSNDEENNKNNSLESCNIDNLKAGKYQPRSHMNQIALNELAESIKIQGIMQPIVVRAVGDKKYEIVAGERRWRAAKLANLSEVPILIKDIPDESALAMALIENIQREDLNSIEEAKGIQRLIDEFGMTHESASHILGKSRTTVTNLLRLLNLSEHVQKALLEGKIEMGHARAMLSLSASEQVMLCHKAINNNLSVREVEELITQTNPSKKKIQTQKIADIVNLETNLSDKLGASVKISHKANGSGVLKINYSNLNQLDSILKKIE